MSPIEHVAVQTQTDSDQRDGEHGTSGAPVNTRSPEHARQRERRRDVHESQPRWSYADGPALVVDHDEIRVVTYSQNHSVRAERGLHGLSDDDEHGKRDDDLDSETP